jgi:two-component system phosphate regulon response regulator PhoB
VRPRESILIVEDNDDLRRMFRTALAFAGYETQEAGDGYIALHLIDQHRPSAIVLDLGLPKVNGYVVLQELMAHAHTRDIPVIIVTAEPSVEQPPGAACLLRKPVTPERLVSTVEACIAQGGGSAQSR